MKEVTLTEFRNWIKAVKVDEILQTKSFVITANGKILAEFTIPRTDYIKEHVKQLGVLSNSVGGKEIVAGKELVSV
jgi:hypothetical protein